MKMETAKPFQASFSSLFMTATLIGCCLSSFMMGKLSKGLLEQELSRYQQVLDSVDDPEVAKMGLPVPLAKGGKSVPETIYTSKNFDTRRSAYSSQWLQKEQDSDLEEAMAMKISEFNESSSELYQKQDDEEHLPAGQHLLVDIDGIDASFLDSEQQLATSMIELVYSSGLTLLSYHCHGLTPAGVSCAGVLLESHVSFHTWPAEGVITLDLFTCGSTSLLNSLDLIENLFAKPRAGVSPRMLWAYKRRGFKEQSAMAGERDTFAYPLGIHGLEVKKEIASTETSTGKQVRIYDINNIYQLPSSSSDLRQGRSDSSETFPDNRLLYLDGVLKANEIGEIPAYESFVHPSMLAHKNPEKVLVVGTGTGASIREVLKHSNVQKVVAIGADETLVEFSKEHLRRWNDCSDLVGGTNSCFDDPRVQIMYDSPSSWVASNTKDATFDVILLDFFDLDELDAATLMEDSISFFSALNLMLDEDGIVSFHVPGDARAVDSGSWKRGSGRQTEQRSKIANDLLHAGFRAAKAYEETETGLIASRNYVVAFEDIQTAEKWNRNEAEVNAEIRKRVVNTISGSPSFKFFDGATMTSYSRASSKDVDMQGTALLREMNDRTITPSPTLDTETISVAEANANQSLDYSDPRFSAGIGSADDEHCENSAVHSNHFSIHESQR